MVFGSADWVGRGASLDALDGKEPRFEFFLRKADLFTYQASSL